jgi:hypothetical protein
MAVSKKNDDDSTYQDDSDDSDTVPSSPKKTSEELFQLAANATLPARRRIQPNMYGSTPSPSPPPPLPKPTTSKKKPAPSKKKPAPLVNSGRTNQSNNKSQKKRGRAATKKKTVSVPVITTTSVPTGNPSLPMNGTFLGSLSLCLFVYVSSIPIIHFDFILFHLSLFNYILPHFSI